MVPVTRSGYLCAERAASRSLEGDTPAGVRTSTCFEAGMGGMTDSCEARLGTPRPSHRLRQRVPWYANACTIAAPVRPHTTPHDFAQRAAFSIVDRAGSKRLALIDALRGFALAGVLLGNLGGFSLYYFMDDSARAAMPSSGFDHWAGLLMQIMVQDKALTLFSLLFGLGIAVQVEQSASKGTGIGPILRRLAVLLVIGLLHAHLFWWGDILTISMRCWDSV